jgi:EAL domain-containing protein (putative c-di-GMP-specific phosphodiesterase class I)
MATEADQEDNESSPHWPRRIREALDRDRFVLHAQPIVELSSGRTLRHELFLRMIEGDQLIPAASFVVAAEDDGSIQEIDRWVVARTIDVAATGHGVHLNLSVRSADSELRDLIQDRLRESGADPGNVVFELSERQLADAGDSTAEFAHGVKDLGCALALDNFVRGGLAFALFRRLPIDYLKLGVPLMQDLARDLTRRNTVESVVNLARQFGQRTVAQGVEDVATLQTLGDLGVDQAQGYALGAPAPLGPLAPASAARTAAAGPGCG